MTELIAKSIAAVIGTVAAGIIGAMLHDVGMDVAAVGVIFAWLVGYAWLLGTEPR